MCLDSDGIIIRPFQAEDQEVVKTLILDGLVEHWGFLDPTKNPDLDDIAASYKDGVFLTAWLDGELAGTGALIPEDEVSLRIVRMSVAKYLRRQGIGRVLLERLCAHTRAAGYRQVVLETTSTWKNAIAFYTRFGFRIIGAWDGDTHFVLELR
ncbi:MAG: GNAT family N-acetyltransferase [Anaerolineae bacterium]|nr:GNAT family N-acetyltransferase [Anaerolineae bacterium]